MKTIKAFKFECKPGIKVLSVPVGDPVPPGGRGGAGGERAGRRAGAAPPARRGAGGGARPAPRPHRPLRRRRALRHLHAARPQPQQGDRARLLYRWRLHRHAGC